MARGHGQRPLLAPAGHPAVHQAGVAAEADVRADAEPLRHARSEPLHQDVRLLQLPQQPVHVTRVLEVQFHGAAPTVEFAVPVRERAGAVGPVDPHHIGPQVSEDHAGERGGPDRR